MQKSKPADRSNLGLIFENISNYVEVLVISVTSLDYYIGSFMLFFPFGINSEEVGERKTNLQFKFSGEVVDACYFVIEQGNITAEKGVKENPDIEIETPFEIWMDIITGKADGQHMFMEQKYTVNGDLPLMIQLFQKKTN